MALHVQFVTASTVTLVLLALSACSAPPESNANDALVRVRIVTTELHTNVTPHRTLSGAATPGTTAVVTARSLGLLEPARPASQHPEEAAVLTAHLTRENPTASLSLRLGNRYLLELTVFDHTHVPVAYGAQHHAMTPNAPTTLRVPLRLVLSDVTLTPSWTPDAPILGQDASVLLHARSPSSTWLTSPHDYDVTFDVEGARAVLVTPEGVRVTPERHPSEHVTVTSSVTGAFVNATTGAVTTQTFTHAVRAPTRPSTTVRADLAPPTLRLTDFKRTITTTGFTDKIEGVASDNTITIERVDVYRGVRLAGHANLKPTLTGASFEFTGTFPACTPSTCAPYTLIAYDPAGNMAVLEGGQLP